MNKEDVKRIEERKERRRVVDRQTVYMHSGRKRMKQIDDKNMKNYQCIETNNDVYVAILQAHPNLIALSHFTSHDDDIIHKKETIETSFSFDQSSFPLIEVKSTWELNDERQPKITHEYWLCIPKK